MTSATLSPAFSSSSLSGSPAVTLRCWRRSPTRITRAFSRFGHVKQLEHVPRAELAGLIDQDDAAPGRFLHLLVLQEPGHRVGIGEACFLPQHFAAGLHRLGQGDHRLPGLGQRLADFLFERRFARAGDAADNHHPVAGAEHMPHGRLLPVVEPVARAWPLGIAQRPATPTPLAGEVDQLRFQRQHLFRRRHLPAVDLAADQRTLAHFACHTLDRDRADAAFQGFGDELAFRHHRLAHETVLDGMIDRQCLATLRPGVRTLAAVNRRQRIAFLVAQAAVPFLPQLFPAQRRDPSFRGSRPRVRPCGRDR